MKKSAAGLVLCGSAMVLLSGCSAPKIAEMRGMESNVSFTVAAPLECLYQQGVERTAGGLNMTEPPFTAFINAQAGTAFFRQPLTLVELKRTPSGETDITRRQTSSAALFGQANDLVAFLKTNPCAESAS
jgi:hypothetical protein